MTGYVVVTVIEIVLAIAALAIYLWIVGGQLTRIATTLEECDEIVAGINADAGVIKPGLDSINATGGVVAGALPLLYDMAEGIVDGATYEPPPPRPPARPASGTRRSRLTQAVGYDPI